jgi:hypothetical protein
VDPASAAFSHITGYRPMTFDAEVTPGQVVPYQGTLQRN